MWRKASRLLFGMLLIGTLVAVYFIIVPGDLVVPETDSSDMTAFIDMDYRDARKLSLCSQDFEAVFITDGKTWAADGEVYPENETNLWTIVKNFSQSAGIVVLENAAYKNLDEYGLNEGMGATVSVMYANGDELTLRVGDPTLDGEGYYAMLDDGGTVYVIPYTVGSKYYYGY